MNRNSRTALFILLGAVLAIVLYLALSSDENFMWTETYVDDGDQPYDLSLFKETLRSSSKDFEVLAGLYADTSYLEAENTTLIYIGGYAFLDSAETALIRKFASKGNSVFVSTRTIGSTLRYLDDCDVAEEEQLTGRFESKKVKVSTSENSAELSLDVYNQPSDHNWIHFSETSCYETLGFIESGDEKQPNLLSKKVGEGRIVVHSNPLVFTNYHMIRDSVFDYVNTVLGSTEGDKFWYLEHSDSPEVNDRPNISESPLRFVLSNPPLKWAWYLIILFTFLYVLNSVRRRQRSIPVQKLPKNQTAEYLDMIYRLFRKEGKHKDIIRSQTKLLQAFLRNKYGLNTHKQNEQFFEIASVKLKLDKKYLEQFFKMLDRAKHNSTLNDADLLEVDREINEFYQKCP